MQFKLYLSGINYSYIQFEKDKVTHSKLNINTNKFESIRELTEEENKYYKELSKIDLLELSSKLKSYQNSFKEEKDIIITDYNEIYSKYEDNLYVQREKVMPIDIVVYNKDIIGFVTTNSSNTAVLVKEGFEDKTPLKLWKDYDKNIYKVSQPIEKMIKMRDNTNLSTLIYLPKDINQKVATILVRTPYGKEDLINRYLTYVQRGYALVLQDVRGRNKSEGEFEPHYYEAEDGDDTINFIAKQPWSNEKVGMIGGSYLGFVQWAAATTQNKYLKALVSIVTSGSPFVDLPRKGGALASGVLAWAFSVSKKEMDREKMNRTDWDEVLNIRPLENIANRALGYDIGFFNRWLEHKDNDYYWKKQSWYNKKENIKVPAMIVSGWFDDNGMATTEALEIVKDYDSKDKKIILGPWMHKANTARDIHNVAFGNNAIRFDLDYYYLQWFDNKLKEIDNKINEGPAVEYYTIGENKWKTNGTWPIDNIEYTDFYLTSEKSANTSSGDGKLVSRKSKNNKDTYNYDPLNPSIHIIDMSENEISVPENYIEIEKREDMLCFSTEPLEKDLTITGEVLVKFYGSSDKKDTDWVVRVLDVDEKGNSIKLVDGILSARYRNGFEEAKFMEEGEIYEFVIRTSKVSNTFKKGHKIRLTITSSAKNYIFPNSNTIDGHNSNVFEIARNNVHHGIDYPSKIILPIEK